MPYFLRRSAFEGAGIVRPSAAAALLLTITLTAGVPLAPAREVGGIDMPEQASVSAGGPALRLNGAGVRRKLFVAYIKGELAGMSNGYTDAEAKRLFARERKVPVADIEVAWTGKKEVSFDTYCNACDKQADFVAA